MRGHRTAPDGTRADSVLFSILAPEWPGVEVGLLARITAPRVVRCSRRRRRRTSGRSPRPDPPRPGGPALSVPPRSPRAHGPGDAARAPPKRSPRGRTVEHLSGRTRPDVVARLLDVGLGLVALALGLEPLVVRELARAFLELATRLFSGVLGLVSESHGCSSRRYLSTVTTVGRARTPSGHGRCGGMCGCSTTPSSKASASVSNRSPRPTRPRSAPSSTTASGRACPAPCRAARRRWRATCATRSPRRAGSRSRSWALPALPVLPVLRVRTARPPTPRSAARRRSTSGCRPRAVSSSGPRSTRASGGAGRRTRRASTSCCGTRSRTSGSRASRSAPTPATAGPQGDPAPGRGARGRAAQPPRGARRLPPGHRLLLHPP